MKFYLITIILLIGMSSSAQQTGDIQVRVTYSDSFGTGNPLDIELYLDTNRVYHYVIIPGEPLTIKDQRPGLYALRLRRSNNRWVSLDGVIVYSSKTTLINTTYPGPCKFDYTTNAKSVCINRHKDQIVPILYGFPTKRQIKKAKDGKLHLGGCVVTDCDPKYYCRVHKREL
jgi:hypothetical protein